MAQGHSVMFRAKHNEPTTHSEMNWKKIAGDILVVAAGALVALYVKESMDKMKVTAPATK